jgi:Mn-containing catalase
MPTTELKELLTDQLRDLLNAETQLTKALPKMADAAHHPKLKEAFQKHLIQTQNHVERLRQVFQAIGQNAESKTCRAMVGLVEEGEETIQQGRQMNEMAADLALIAAAQRVEHYEISAYGTARTLARQMGEVECAKLLSHTLGEEESADYLLTAISEPILQQLTLTDAGAKTNLDHVPTGKGASTQRETKTETKVRKAG